MLFLTWWSDFSRFTQSELTENEIKLQNFKIFKLLEKFFEF